MKRLATILFDHVEKNHPEAFKEDYNAKDDLKLREDCVDYIHGTLFKWFTNFNIFVDHIGRQRKYVVMYNPYIVLLCGNAIAMNGGVIDDTWHTTLIIVDQRFFELPESCRNAIIAHEFGHIVLQHNGKRRIAQQEIAADRYAAGIVGTNIMRDALGTILDCATINSDPISKYLSRKEIKERIKQLH